MRVIGNWIYFINVSDDNKICRMDVNGQNLESLSEEGVVDMAVYDNKIYYSYQDDGAEYLKAMNFDGSGKQALANMKTRHMVVEDGYIYYIDRTDEKFYRFRLEDKAVEKLSDERAIGVTQNWILYTSTDGKKPPTSKRIMKDGANKISMGSFISGMNGESDV